MQNHIRKVHACLVVTRHLPFWQNGRDVLRATAVTRGWNGYRNKKFLPRSNGSNGHLASLTKLITMLNLTTKRCRLRPGFEGVGEASDDDAGVAVLHLKHAVFPQNCRTRR